MGKILRGAAKITHSINEYGGNKGMAAGLTKFANDNQRIGYQKAVSDMQRLSFLDCLLGNLSKSKK